MSKFELASKSILVVDDTPANLHMLIQVLTDQGYRVRAATSGARALAAVQAALPDLVLLDIKMPEMDGYEVCERLKADAKTRDVPVIFLSALDEIDDKVKAFGVGGVDYVTKPFQFEEVLARIETHLALRDLQQQLQRANQRLEQELTLAGEIQASFLPRDLPEVPGWQVSVTLRPARQMSGDYYDVISLPNGRVGILIADVADKGAGAALYMALTWTLLRTYITEFPDRPELVFAAVNQRVLTDTETSQFVTLFFGTLDPSSGKLVYANAGHNPPYLFGQQGAQSVEKLARTGMPLGVIEDTIWERAEAQVEQGGMLVLYTDGITEAHDEAQSLYGEKRLLESLSARAGCSAVEVRDGLLADVAAFAGDAPQQDDIAVIVIQRNREG